jgi:hypothetical protein
MVPWPFDQALMARIGACSQLVRLNLYRRCRYAPYDLGSTADNRPQPGLIRRAGVRSNGRIRLPIHCYCNLIVAVHTDLTAHIQPYPFVEPNL